MNKQKQFVGFDLFPWQAEVHKGLLKYGLGTSHIHIVKSKRQCGKSLLIIGELLYFALNYSNTINGCLSPTLNQARKIYKDIINGVEKSGVIKKKNDSLLEITFINGSTILFKSAEQKDALRGYTYTGLLCIDEASYIQDEIFSIVKPSTDVHRCPVLITSTPKFRLGFFFELFSKGLTGKKGISSYDFNNYDTSALLTNEALEMYRQMLPKNQFTTEYLGEFMDADSSVFVGYKECIQTEPIDTDYKDIYIGIDWGNGTNNDDTVICGINEKGEQIFLEYFNNKNTTEQIDYISLYITAYMPRIKKILCESNSLGKPLTELLRTKIKKPHLVQDWLTTNESKARLVSQLQVGFEQQQVTLINDDKQSAELSMYEATYNIKTGNVSYNAPLGGNDDIVIGLMLALEAKSSTMKTGQYSFLFI